MNFSKRFTYYLTGLILIETTCFPAIAQANERDVSPEEREKIVQTLKSIDCQGFDNAEYYTDKQRFEIDQVVCADGRKYEIYLDQSYRIIKKELDD
ncbi:MAG: hypothetical protein RLZZ490_1882 [Cyanobacteriota bacterium]|jgi:hypothetical protein